MSCYFNVADGLIRANDKAVLFRQKGHNKFGQPVYVKTGTFGIQIVKIEFKEQKSSIRVDTSASKSTIDEEIYDGVIYMSPKAKVAIADKVRIKVMGSTHEFRVARIANIFTLFGELAYYEIGLIRSGA